MKRRNHSSNVYLISNPTLKNENTGNFSISPKDVMRYDKDFLFEWENPHTHKLEKKVIDKRYVVDHMKPCNMCHKDEDGNKKHGFCYLISYKDIIKY